VLHGIREPVDLGLETIKLACRVNAVKVSCEGGAGPVQVAVERVLSAQTLTASPGRRPKRMSATLRSIFGAASGSDLSYWSVH
jgi:hypothetical protein